MFNSQHSSPKESEHEFRSVVGSCVNNVLAQIRAAAAHGGGCSIAACCRVESDLSPSRSFVSVKGTVMEMARDVTAGPFQSVDISLWTGVDH